MAEQNAPLDKRLSDDYTLTFLDVVFPYRSLDDWKALFEELGEDWRTTKKFLRNAIETVVGWYTYHTELEEGQSARESLREVWSDLREELSMRKNRKHCLPFTVEYKRYELRKKWRAEAIDDRCRNASFNQKLWRLQEYTRSIREYFLTPFEQTGILKQLTEGLRPSIDEQARILHTTADIAKQRIADIIIEEQKLKELFLHPEDHLYTLLALYASGDMSRIERTSEKTFREDRYLGELRAQDAVADICKMIEATHLLCARHLELPLSRFGSRAEIQKKIAELGHTDLAEHLRDAYFHDPAFKFLISYNNDKKHALGSYRVVPRRTGYHFKHKATYRPVLETVSDAYGLLGERLPLTIALLDKARSLEPRGAEAWLRLQ
jgi:hypothetical protein